MSSKILRRFTKPGLLIVSLLMSSSAVSANFYAGVSAYEAKDYKTALREWRPLAEQGDAAAQFHIGVIYFNGQGVIQDYKEALKWYHLAAKKMGKAQLNIGFMYFNGQGVIQDYKETLKWFTIAANGGYTTAQNNLAIMYFNGYGVLQDYVTAHMWANLATSNGHSPKIRDMIAKKMTASQLEQAQKKAREWVVKRSN